MPAPIERKCASKYPFATVKQLEFAQAFYKSGNATEAFRKAYPTTIDWTPAAVSVAACKMLKNGKVQLRLHELEERAKAKFDIDQDKVLKELGDLGFSDMGDFAEWGGTKIRNGVKGAVLITDSKKLASTKAVSEISTNRFGETKIKLHDKVAALDKLARHLGMYEDAEAGKGSVQIAIVLNGKDADL
jgi:phage terminase small subunit